MVNESERLLWTLLDLSKTTGKSSKSEQISRQQQPPQCKVSVRRFTHYAQCFVLKCRGAKVFFCEEQRSMVKLTSLNVCLYT